MTLVCALSWEGYLRSRGVRVSVGHGDAAWHLTRMAVMPNSTVLIGASRLQSAVDPTLLGEILEENVVQLAVLGSSPVPVLEDLAADPTFRGRVLMSFIPRMIFDASGAAEREVSALLRSHESWRSPAKLSEARLSARVRGRLALRRQDLTFANLAREALRGHPPKLPYVTTRIDRSRWLDFRKTTPADREHAMLSKAKLGGPPASPEEVQREIARIESAAQTLIERGGEVVVLRLPSGGAVAAYEEERFPRAAYWDVFAARTSLRAVHYADTAAFSGFDCPDGSHLDQRDMPRFTRAIASLVADPEAMYAAQERARRR